MPRQSWREIQRDPVLGHVGYWVAGLLVGAIWIALFVVAHTIKQSEAVTDDALAAVAAVAAVSAQLSAAEGAQRAFLLTGDRDAIADREVAIAHMHSDLDTLARISAARPEQLARIQKLRTLANEREAIMRESERLRGVDDPRALSERATRAHAATNRFVRQAAQVRQGELDALQARREDRHDSNRRADLVLVVTAVLAFLVLVPTYLGFILQARQRSRFESQLRDLAQNLPGAIVQWRNLPDGSRRYEFLSEAAERIRGIDRAAAFRRGASVAETIVPEDQARVHAAIVEAGREERPVEVDYRAALPGRGVRSIRLSARPRREHDGAVLWTGEWYDVTEGERSRAALVEAKEEAERVSSAKSTFLATVSHEIRTPMHGMLGMLELLGMSQLQPNQRNTLRLAIESGHSLMRIIDDILDFSKIDAGRFELHPAPVVVRELVERVRAMYAGTASNKGLQIEQNVDPAMCPVLMMDALRVGQVLNNLVNNAVKFTQRGRVEIRAERLERRALDEVVAFEVRDTGPGISPELQERLFNPFVQGGESVRSGSGTGLGLAICRRLAQLMGGQLTMHSAPGQGTTLRFVAAFPVADGALANREEAREVRDIEMREPVTRDEAIRQNTLLLLVDDHPVNLMLLERQVHVLGYAAETAGDGIQALQRWSEGHFAAIITDVNMPGMDGYELARRVRAAEARLGRPRTRIIACTANALHGEADNCLAAGMDDYLSKPVQLAHLADQLRAWLPLPDAPIRTSVLNDLSNGDRALELRLLGLFRQHRDDDVARLADAVEAGDPERVVQAAHRIKGATATLGAMEACAIAGAIEGAARAADVAAARELLPRLAAELARVEEQIARIEGKDEG